MLSQSYPAVSLPPPLPLCRPFADPPPPPLSLCCPAITVLCCAVLCSAAPPLHPSPPFYYLCHPFTARSALFTASLPNLCRLRHVRRLLVAPSKPLRCPLPPTSPLRCPSAASTDPLLSHFHLHRSFALPSPPVFLSISASSPLSPLSVTDLQSYHMISLNNPSPAAFNDSTRGQGVES